MLTLSPAYYIITFSETADHEKMLSTEDSNTAVISPNKIDSLSQHLLPKKLCAVIFFIYKNELCPMRYYYKYS